MIKTVKQLDSDGGLKVVYPEQRKQAGDLANILRALVLEILQPHLGIYRAMMHATGDLSRVHREMIAVAVSAANVCDH
jgi:alkylhydroperoxidase family enzyme